MLEDKEKRRKHMLEEREKRKQIKEKDRQKRKKREERGTVWKLFFKPDPEFAKFFAEPIPWLIGAGIFFGIIIIVLKLFEFFTS